MHFHTLSFWQKLCEGFFRLRLYVRGIHFYEKERSETSVLASQLVWQITKTLKVDFQIYKEKKMDRVLRRNSVAEDHYHNYYVIAHFDPVGNDRVGHLNGVSFFFHGKVNQLQKDENLVFSLIVDVYMDLLSIYSPID